MANWRMRSMRTSSRRHMSRVDCRLAYGIRRRSERSKPAPRAVNSSTAPALLSSTIDLSTSRSGSPGVPKRTIMRSR